MRPRLPKYLDWLRTQPCLGCGNNISTEAAHVRMPDPYLGKPLAGTGNKPADFWALPLCGECHRESHDVGEKKFWGSKGIDAPVVALAFFVNSHNQSAIDMIYRQWRNVGRI